MGLRGRESEREAAGEKGKSSSLSHLPKKDVMNECQGHKTSSSCLTRDSPNPQLGGDGQRAKGRRVKEAKREKLCFANSCVHWQRPVCVTEFTLTYNPVFSTEA